MRTAAGNMKDRQQEDQNSHTSDPMGKASPEKNTFRKNLYIRDDTGTCGGKAGHCLKKGVYGIGDRAADEKGGDPIILSMIQLRATETNPSLV